MQPVEVTGLDMAFGGDMSKLIPKDIPEGHDKFEDIVAKWFFQGLPDGTEFVPKNGIDKNKALKHIASILRSFEPKHEVKMAACAYLAEEWFEDIKVPGKKP